jgi:SagB-type dehydrogenase family enzyme
MSASRRSPVRVLVRRAPHVVVYWDDEGLVLENYRTGDRVRAAAVMLDILAFFDRARDPVALSRHLPAYPSTALAGAVADLIAHSILERSGRAQTPADRAFRSWSAWHPAAGLLHFSSKDLPYRDAQRARSALRRDTTRQRRPPAVKRYRQAPRVALPPPRQDGEFARVLLDRRTWRRFSRRPVSLDALGTLLGVCARVQHWADVPGVGRLPLKTYPSGGAQHPLEVYVLATRVAGLAPGLYHYAADAHHLERLKKGADAKTIAQYLPTQDWYGAASALILITAVFPRMQWKYRFARAYRAVLTEAGHLCQNVCLAATWLGLAPFCSLALADSRIERDLGVDGVSESILYAAGVGTRPPDTTWAPWPTPRRIRLEKA